MTRPTWTTRPEQHPERATVRAFADALPVDRLSAYGKLALAAFVSAADGFDRARSSNQEAAARVDQAQAEVRSASGSFGSAFDCWTLGVDRVHGKGFTRRELPVHLGNRSASVFLKTGARSRVDRMTALLAYVEASPGWRGDEDRLADLVDATAALDRTVGASEDALRERARAVRALRTAALAFDKRWGKVVDDLRDTDPALAREVPRFRRGAALDDQRNIRATPATAPTSPPIATSPAGSTRNLTEASENAATYAPTSTSTAPPATQVSPIPTDQRR